jgi:hypothetical protein
MKSKRLGALAAATALALALGTSIAAQGSKPIRLAGTINDYVVGGGAWHVTAKWSVHANGGSGKADFSAAFTMVRSDLWVLLTGASTDDPEVRAPHTHHVHIRRGQVTALPNGFRITGTATITGSGNWAGFSPSPVQVDIIGGDAVRYSNIRVSFGGAAAGHFGPHPIDGVVVTAQ